ncbi:MAG: hypothetical protein PHG58_10675 [Clostridia bacterium]|nr:hypothetical protein [Clostridia bacterium]
METKFNIKASRIRELLDKYFNGETSLDEEKMLREYFSGNQTDAEFEQYAPMFNYFSGEIDSMGLSEKTVLPEERHTFARRLFYGSFSLAAAAAVAIFTFILWPDKQTGVEMMIGGQRVNNEQLAITKTETQLAKISAMMGLVSESTSSLDKLSSVRKSLSAINQINDTNK